MTADSNKKNDLEKILQSSRGQRHIIVLQDYPDPDAISSAFAHQIISASYDIEVDIIYGERISHPQNQALVKLLCIDLLHYEPDMDLSRYSGAVFVDNQGTTADVIVAALKNAGIPTLIVVDHHEMQEVLTSQYSDIRRTNATATIYAEYLEQGLFKLDPNKKEHVMLATSLLHGIITDTGGFIRANVEDFQAAAFLSLIRDSNLLAQIMSQARSRQTMEVIRKALGNRIIVESISIAGIGFLRSEDRDAIPQTADFLLTEENLHTAIVYGIVSGDGAETLVGSMRTLKLTVNPDEFIKDVFGKDAAGRYFGGGRLSAGGFAIPLGFLADGPKEEYQELKWQVYDAQVKQKIFAKIGYNLKSSRITAE